MICPPLREAERRFCAVGIPAWMPGEPCWARDGPSRRAHGAGPERGNLSEAKAVRWGEDFLVPFWSFKKGLAVRAKPIVRLDLDAGYVLNVPVKQTRSSRPQPPAQHIEQVTTVAQQLRRNRGQMLEINSISLLHFAAGERFHQLSYSQNAGDCVGMEYIEWGVAVDQQGGDGAVDGGKRNVR